MSSRAACAVPDLTKKGRGIGKKQSPAKFGGSSLQYQGGQSRRSQMLEANLSYTEKPSWKMQQKSKRAGGEDNARAAHTDKKGVSRGTAQEKEDQQESG